jgi:hypothetical protein
MMIKYDIHLAGDRLSKAAVGKRRTVWYIRLSTAGWTATL